MEIKEKDGIKYYPTICCNCQAEFHAALSIFQQGFGMLDMGSGSCPYCHTSLRLKFIPDENKQESSLRKGAMS